MSAASWLQGDKKEQSELLEIAKLLTLMIIVFSVWILTDSFAKKLKSYLKLLKFAKKWLNMAVKKRTDVKADVNAKAHP